MSAIVERLQAICHRLDVMESRLEALESLQKNGNIPEGYGYLSILAANYGLSTAKAQELAQASGVSLARHRNQYIVHEVSFNEVALYVTSRAKRKVGSKYWYHPLIGKFQMTKAVQK